MKIVSRPVAADWARKSLDKEWLSLIDDAQAVDNPAKKVDNPIERIQHFVDWCANGCLEAVEARGS
jgi:hypothetical protein